MMFFIEDSKDGKSLAQKMARDGQDGAIIPCSKGELEAAKSMHVIGLGKESGPIRFVPIEDGKRYIAVVDSDYVNIDDLLKATPKQVSIVRARL